MKKTTASLAVIVAVLLIAVGSASLLAYWLSDYDEQTTDVYNVPIQVSINPSTTSPSWTDTAYVNVEYHFMLEIYSSENVTGILHLQASPCKSVSDIELSLTLHNTSFPFSTTYDDGVITGIFDTPFAFVGGELLYLPCEVIFTQSGRYTIGFWVETD
jgi:hypothetical protein